jgi:hypothetical protein
VVERGTREPPSSVGDADDDPGALRANRANSAASPVGKPAAASGGRGAASGGCNANTHKPAPLRESVRVATTRFVTNCQTRASYAKIVGRCYGRYGRRRRLAKA